MNDTIAAISTALGVGAISIIRVSGKEAISIVNKVFEKKDLEKVDSHTIHYGHIVDKNEVIDEVLVSVMRGPKTFTAEDVVEINCHGGIASTKKILEVLLLNGCRLAEPGEFTRRAFVNGRIDLVKAESVMNVIKSENDNARRVAMKGLDGFVSEKIRMLRKKMLEPVHTGCIKILRQEMLDVLYQEFQQTSSQSRNDAHRKAEYQDKMLVLYLFFTPRKEALEKTFLIGHHRIHILIL